MASVTYVYPKQYDLPMRTMEEMRREVIKKYKFGDYIRDDDNQKVRIVAFYENYVLCHNGYGYETCMSYFDLWQRLQTKKRR
mgnify:CR=1 FL=1